MSKKDRMLRLAYRYGRQRRGISAMARVARTVGCDTLLWRVVEDFYYHGVKAGRRVR